MKAFTTARCGSDMDVRYTNNGDPIGTVSLAVRLGKKDKQTGEYMTQWVRASLWGKRADSLAPYIKKGSLHAFHLRDLRIEEFTGKDGNVKTSMVAEIDDVELCSKQAEPAQHSASSAATRAQAPAQPRQAQRPAASGGGASGFDDMDDDIPFATASISHDVIWRKLDRARVV